MAKLTKRDMIKWKKLLIKDQIEIIKSAEQRIKELSAEIIKIENKGLNNV
jgi:hypothetical protein